MVKTACDREKKSLFGQGEPIFQGVLALIAPPTLHSTL